MSKFFIFAKIYPPHDDWTCTPQTAWAVCANAKERLEEGQEVLVTRKDTTTIKVKLVRCVLFTRTLRGDGSPTNKDRQFWTFERLPAEGDTAPVPVKESTKLGDRDGES